MKRGVFVLLSLVLCGAGAWYYADPDKARAVASKLTGLKLGGGAVKQVANGEGGRPGGPPRGGPGGASRGGPGGGAGGGPAASRGRGGPPLVVTAVAQTSNFPVRLRSIGFVEPEATVLVKSRVQSQLLEQHVKDGQMVKKGDLLFTLDDQEIRAQLAKNEAQLAKDQATLARIRNDKKRAQMLLARNAGTQQALELATANENELLAVIKGDQAVLVNDRLRLSYTKIYAPITGRVGTINVTPGNLVNASDSGSGLVTITRMSPVRVSFTLPERELSQVRLAVDEGSPPEVRATPHSGGETTSVGKVNFIDSTVERASGTFTLKARIANEKLELWPGQYCDIVVNMRDRENAVSVPAVALQVGQKGSFVYAVSPDSRVHVRYVKTGLTENNRVEIVTGLKAGEKIVIDGQTRLKPGALVREIVPGQRPGQQQGQRPGGKPPQRAGADKSVSAREPASNQ